MVLCGRPSHSGRPLLLVVLTPLPVRAAAGVHRLKSRRKGEVARHSPPGLLPWATLGQIPTRLPAGSDRTGRRGGERLVRWRNAWVYLLRCRDGSLLHRLDGRRRAATRTPSSRSRQPLHGEPAARLACAGDPDVRPELGPARGGTHQAPASRGEARPARRCQRERRYAMRLISRGRRMSPPANWVGAHARSSSAKRRCADMDLAADPSVRGLSCVCRWGGSVMGRGMNVRCGTVLRL